MRRIKVGDIFEINTTKGRGYLQYVYGHPTIGELIRILPGLYEAAHPDFISLAASKELYFVHFPLKAAYRRSIVKLIDNFELPPDLVLPKKMRTKHVVRGDFVAWHIVDYDTWKIEAVKELSPEQIKLSPWGSWNDTLLIERMASEWTLDKWV